MTNALGYRMRSWGVIWGRVEGTQVPGPRCGSLEVENGGGGVDGS